MVLASIGYAQSEICDNGIDDDGDGLIDCCDPDLATDECCLAYFASIDSANCTYAPASEFEFELQENEITDFWIPNANYSPLVGDIDFDGRTEFLMLRYAGNATNNIDDWHGANELLILDTEDWSVKYSYSFDFLPNKIQGSLAIGDVDCDHKGDILICENNVLYRLEYEPNLNNGLGGIQLVESRFISFPNAVTSNRPNLTLADLNGDDNPELIIGNHIYDAQTLEPIVNGGTNNSMGMNNIVLGRLRVDIVALDVLAYDAVDCPDCEGLEIIAGNQVYAVDLDVPSMTVRRDFRQLVPQVGDGTTAVADIDQNGTYDAVVVHKPFDDTGIYYVYAYDIETLTPLASHQDGYVTVNSPQRFGPGRPTLVNVDSDPQLEIIFVTGDQLHVFEDDLTEKWTDVIEDFSGHEVSTAFDFDGDSKAELLFRDEYELRIYDASGAVPQILYTTRCLSDTGQEPPVIADFDNDGQAEIACSCIVEEYADLTSANNPKGPGKLRVYENVGSPWPAALPVWNQRGFNITNIANGLKIPAMPLDNLSLEGGVGGSLLNSFGAQLGIYDTDLQNYLAGDATIQLDSFRCAEEGGVLFYTLCNQGSHTLSPDTPISWYLSDPTSSSTSALLTTIPLTEALEPGACQQLSISLDEYSGRSIWALVNDAGTTAAPIALSADLPNTSVAECDYSNNLDSLSLPMRDSTFLSLEICEGDTASIFESLLTEAGVYTEVFQNVEGCDSVVILDLMVSALAISSIDTLLCPGSFIIVNGTTYNEAQPMGIEVLEGVAQNGCDSVVNVRINYIDEVESYLQVLQPPCSYNTLGQLAIDSTKASNLALSLDGVNYSTDTVFDQLVEGAYRLYIRSEVGCNFIYDFEIEAPAPLLRPTGGGFNLDQGCTLSLEAALNTDDSLAYSWSPAEGLSCTDCPTPITQVSQNTTYTVTVTNADGCQEQQAIAVEVGGDSGVYVPNAFSPNSDGVNDFFRPYASDCVREIVYFRVFDRWGNFVFEVAGVPPDIADLHWDGTFRGQPVKPGVFAWTLKVVYENGRIHQLSGDVQLAR